MRENRTPGSVQGSPGNRCSYCDAKTKERNISFYYAIDGDDIGKRLEEYALRNDISAIRALSENVRNSLSRIQDYFLAEGGETIFCEGDSILLCSENEIYLPIKILIHNDISFSAGIGRTTAMALLALKKAKGLGKRRVEVFMDELR